MDENDYGAFQVEEAVAALPMEYLTNYVESYEAGIVGSAMQCRFCVAGCMATPANVRDENVRERGYARINMEPAVDELEMGYIEATVKYRRPGPFRTRLYDACVAELASRVSLPLPAEVG
jgi:hypothetical protein